MSRGQVGKNRPWRAWLFKWRTRLVFEAKKSTLGVLIWLGALLVISLASFSGFLVPFSDQLLDGFSQLRGQVEAPSPALVVEIDEQDLKRYGPLPWDWSRWDGFFAQLPKDMPVVTTLSPALLFPHTSPETGGEIWQRLGSGALILGTPSTEDGRNWLEEKPNPPWPNAKTYPLALRPDDDGRLRRVPLTVAEAGGAQATAFGQLQRYLGHLDLPSTIRVHYWRDQHALSQMPAWRILEGEIPREALDDRALFLGLAPSLGGGYWTPLSPPTEAMGAGALLGRALLSIHSQAPLSAPNILAPGLILTLAMSLFLSRSRNRALFIRWPALLLFLLASGILFYLQGIETPIAEALALIFCVGALIALLRLRRLARLLDDLQLSAWKAESEIPLFEQEAMDQILSALYHAISPFHPVENLLMAIRPPGAQWVEIIGGIGAQEGDLAERRRDPTRFPWVQSLESVQGAPLRGFMHDQSLETHLVPMRYLGELQGFIILNLKGGLRGDGARWSHLLAPEISVKVHQILEEISLRAGEVVSEQALHQMENQFHALMGQRMHYRCVLDALPIGLLMTDRLGQVQLLNREMADLSARWGLDGRITSLSQLVAHLNSTPPERLAPRFEALLQRGTPLSFRFREKDEQARQFEAHIFGFWPDQAQKKGVPHGLLMTITTPDHSQHDEAIRLFMHKLEDDMGAIVGMSGLLRLTQSLSADATGWVQTIDDRAQALLQRGQMLVQKDEGTQGSGIGPLDLLELIRDVKSALGMPYAAQIEIEAPPVGVSPVMGDRGRIHRAIALLLDSLAGQVDGENIHVLLEEGEGSTQGILIRPPIHGLAEGAANRLFERVQMGEVEGLAGEDTPESMARQWITDGGGMLSSGLDDQNHLLISIEFPKL